MQAMRGIGIVLLIVLVALLTVFVRRRLVMGAGGTIKLAMRLTSVVPGRGWAPGFGRFADDQLRWYRMFSFGFRPKRVLTRQDLTVESRRQPDGAERLAMPPGWI